MTILNNENDFRKWLVGLLEPYAHVTEMEMHGRPGFPDLDYCTEGTCGQIELKYATVKRPPRLRASQKRWFRARIEAGGTPMIWLLASGKVHVFTVGHYRPLLEGNHTLSQWVSRTDQVLPVGNPHMIRWLLGFMAQN